MGLAPHQAVGMCGVVNGTVINKLVMLETPRQRSFEANAMMAISERITRKVFLAHEIELAKVSSKSSVNLAWFLKVKYILYAR